MNEILEDITMDEYQSNGAYSRSDLMLVKKTPYHFFAKKNKLFEEKESDALVLGELLHCMVLEAEDTDSRFIAQPKIDRRTKKGKKLHEEFLIDAGDKKVIDFMMFQKAATMAQSILALELSRSILEGCLIERSIFWPDEESGLEFKCRPDAYNPESGLIVDVKTTRDASKKAFTSSAVRYGYYLQAAMMREALRFHKLPFSKFVFLCVESSEPYVGATYILDDSAIDSGLIEFDTLKKRLARCLHMNRFEHYPVSVLTYPTWGLNEIEDFEDESINE